MSKINAARLININYNNNAIRISDEIFHFNGESTLISLRSPAFPSCFLTAVTRRGWWKNGFWTRWKAS